MRSKNIRFNTESSILWNELHQNLKPIIEIDMFIKFKNIIKIDKGIIGVEHLSSFIGIEIHQLWQIEITCYGKVVKDIGFRDRSYFGTINVMKNILKDWRLCVRPMDNTVKKKRECLLYFNYRIRNGHTYAYLVVVVLVGETATFGILHSSSFFTSWKLRHLRARINIY